MTTSPPQHARHHRPKVTGRLGVIGTAAAFASGAPSDWSPAAPHRWPRRAEGTVDVNLLANSHTVPATVANVVPGGSVTRVVVGS
jgi:hypothetical protein